MADRPEGTLLKLALMGLTPELAWSELKASLRNGQLNTLSPSDRFDLQMAEGK